MSSAPRGGASSRSASAGHRTGEAEPGPDDGGPHTASRRARLWPLRLLRQRGRPVSRACRQAVRASGGGSRLRGRRGRYDRCRSEPKPVPGRGGRARPRSQSADWLLVTPGLWFAPMPERKGPSSRRAEWSGDRFAVLSLACRGCRSAVKSGLPPLLGSHSFSLQIGQCQRTDARRLRSRQPSVQRSAWPTRRSCETQDQPPPPFRHSRLLPDGCTLTRYTLVYGIIAQSTKIPRTPSVHDQSQPGRAPTQRYQLHGWCSSKGGDGVILSPRPRDWHASDRPVASDAFAADVEPPCQERES